MRVLITFIGGASSIEGEFRENKLDDIVDYLSKNPFIILEKTPYGDVVVNKSSISYIRRKQ